MSEANTAAPCPHGHTDTVKLLSTIALSGFAGGASALTSAGASPSAGGGCCGGGCCG